MVSSAVTLAAATVQASEMFFFSYRIMKVPRQRIYHQFWDGWTFGRQILLQLLIFGSATDAIDARSAWAHALATNRKRIMCNKPVQHPGIPDTSCAAPFLLGSHSVPVGKDHEGRGDPGIPYLADMFAKYRTPFRSHSQNQEMQV